MAIRRLGGEVVFEFQLVIAYCLHAPDSHESLVERDR